MVRIAIVSFVDVADGFYKTDVYKSFACSIELKPD